MSRHTHRPLTADSEELSGHGHHHESGHERHSGHDDFPDDREHTRHGDVAHAHSHDHEHQVEKHFHKDMTAEDCGAVQSHRPEERRRLRLAVGITAATMVLEIAGGMWTGSLALISDAGHMFTHAAALFVSLIAMSIACRPTTSERSFGLYRVEVLAALFNAASLAVVTIFIAREAWVRLMNPQPILTGQMFAVAVMGLFVNVATALILRGAGHDDLNFRSAFLHMVGDTLSSVAIVIGAVVIRVTGWQRLDPVLSVLICLVILWWAWGLLRDSVHILMESAPKGLRAEEVGRRIAERFPEVRAVDDIHLWTITSGMNAMTAFVLLSQERPLAEQSRLAGELRRCVAEEFRIGHAVFQFEPAEDDVVG